MNRWVPGHGVGCAGVPRARGDEPLNSSTNGPAVLGRAYADDHLPVVKRQLQRAGVRLALLLNRALD